MSPLLATLIVIAALALAVGGIWTVRAGRRMHGILMVSAALVILANLAIAMLPVSTR